MHEMEGEVSTGSNGKMNRAVWPVGVVVPSIFHLSILPAWCYAMSVLSILRCNGFCMARALSVFVESSMVSWYHGISSSRFLFVDGDDN